MSNTPALTITALMSQANVKGRFEEILGQKAAGFISSVVNVTNGNKSLAEADPRSVLASAVVAATLDLPINPSLGYAAIVPYRNKSGKQIAQFQMMARGFVQLGLRSNQYRNIHFSDVYEDELAYWNPLTGEFAATPMESWTQRKQEQRDKIVGYVSYFRLLGGFEKYLFMYVPQLHAHGQRYSKSYSKPEGMWQKDFPVMANKTVLKQLLSKWGILSVDMQSAIHADQAIVTPKNSDMTELDFSYDDAINVESEPVTDGQPAAGGRCEETFMKAQEAGKGGVNKG